MNDIHTHQANIYDKILSYYFSNEFKSQNKDISPVMNQAIKNGENISKEQYLSSLKKQSELISNFNKSMDYYDVILTLSTTSEASLLIEKEN